MRRLAARGAAGDAGEVAATAADIWDCAQGWSRSSWRFRSKGQWLISDDMIYGLWYWPSSPERQYLLWVLRVSPCPSVSELDKIWVFLVRKSPNHNYQLPTAVGSGLANDPFCASERVTRYSASVDFLPELHSYGVPRVFCVLELSSLSWTMLSPAEVDFQHPDGCGQQCSNQNIFEPWRWDPELEHAQSIRHHTLQPPNAAPHDSSNTSIFWLPTAPWK
ncbi:hypothetical protein ACRRTK_004406 [Alexandromys fortis]